MNMTHLRLRFPLTCIIVAVASLTACASQQKASEPMHERMGVQHGRMAAQHEHMAAHHERMAAACAHATKEARAGREPMSEHCPMKGEQARKTDAQEAPAPAEQPHDHDH